MAASQEGMVRTSYQPLHPSVRPHLEVEYVQIHDEVFQYIRPDAQWDPTTRESNRFGAFSSPPEKVGSVQDISVDNFALRIYRPDGNAPPAGFSVVLWCHSGGGVYGSLSTDEHVCTKVCNDASCVVVSVDYRLAPEHPYPAAVEDCYDALIWVFNKGPSMIGINRSSVMVAGLSASVEPRIYQTNQLLTRKEAFRGGNFAVATVIKATQSLLDGGLRKLVAIAPTLDNTATPESKSWQQRPHAPVLTGERVTFYQNLYLGSRARASWAGSDPTASPLLASQHVLSKFPPTHLMIPAQDVLQAESHEFAEKLEKAAVNVSVQVYEKAPHMFMSMDGVLPSGRQAVVDLVEVVRETFPSQQST